MSGWRATTTLAALMAVNGLCQIDRMLPFVLSESIKRDLQLSDTQLGLLNGVAFAVCYALMSFPLARWADRGSPKQLLLLCLLVWSTMTWMGSQASGFMTLAATRFGVALGEAGATPAGLALIARLLDPRRRGLAIGLFTLGVPLGSMVGFAVGGRVADLYGWRLALAGAGLSGWLLAIVVAVAIPRSQPQVDLNQQPPFWQASVQLVRQPAFRSMIGAAVLLGFAAVPFYVFVTPFMTRVHGYTAAQAGMAFGLLQGVLGIVGALAGGRGFDRAIARGQGLLNQPALLMLVAAFTTSAGLFANSGAASLALFAPGMLSFAFLLPWAYGSSHLVAGPGREALASSVILLASGLLGPALGPALVGVISDGVTENGIVHGLRWGLILVPVASLLSGLLLLQANRRLQHFRAGREARGPGFNPSPRGALA